MTNKEKIVIAGGSGFLGKILSKYFHAKGMEIAILSRRKFHSPYASVAIWDGENLGPWVKELEGAKALINLAGLAVHCRYSEANKHKLIDSRVLSTRILGEAIKTCENKPEAWLNSSTATIYEHTYGEAHTESGKTGPHPDAKDKFSLEIAKKWEDEFNKADCPGVRKIILRSAIVFGNVRGTAYQIFRRLVRFGFGGKMADGNQFVSWIHEDDFCRAVEFLINNKSSSGIYNIAAPNPVTNKEMMKILRKVLGMPFGLPAGKLLLEIGAFFIRTETELIIKSRKVISERLKSESFKFKYPVFEEAILNLES